MKVAETVAGWMDDADRGDPGRIARWFADDATYQCRRLDIDVRGRASVRAAGEMLLAVAPGRRMRVRSIVADESSGRAAVEYTLTGLVTSDGMPSLGPRGTRFEREVCEVVQVHDGLIWSARYYDDTPADAVPTPPAAHRPAPCDREGAGKLITTFVEAFNAGEVERALGFFTADRRYVMAGQGIRAVSRVEHGQVFAAYLAAVPDRTITVSALSQDGLGRAVLEYDWAGTVARRLSPALPEPGRPVLLQGCDIIHLRDGLICYERTYLD